MSVLSLNLSEPLSEDIATQIPPSGRFGRFTHDVSRFWFPTRGFLLSVLIHEIAIAIIISIPPSSSSPSSLHIRSEKQWEVTLLPKDVLYLPQLGGGNEAGKTRGPKGNTAIEPRRASPAATGTASSSNKESRGVTYAGRQKIVSNPENPTNHIQTILHPDLPHPPILKEFVPLPNIVSLAQPPPPPPEPAVKPVPEPPEPVKPEVHPLAKLPANMPVQYPTPSLPSPPPVEAPQLVMPAQLPDSAGTTLHAAVLPPPPARPLPPKETPKPAHHSPQALPAPAKQQEENLLAVSAISSPPNPQVKVPAAEARGQFTISPEAKADTSLPAAGPVANASPASARGEGAASVAAAGHMGSGTGVSEGGGSGSGKGGGAGLSEGSGSGRGKREGTGSAEGSGLGSGKGGNGSGKGRGTGSGGEGEGAGSGVGTGTGSGAGAGSGPGGGAFAGMSIEGGEGPAGAVAVPAPKEASTSDHEPSSYGMTIISTGNSGGGVGDFGVFADEAVFTVYLNPTEGTSDPSPPWPLQYSVLNYTGENLQDLLPPYALKTQLPTWPAELIERYGGRELVIYAVINAEGKMEHPRVLQSPDARLSNALLAALGSWVFRPASLNGKPAALKVVLGVPIPSARQ